MKAPNLAQVRPIVLPVLAVAALLGLWYGLKAGLNLPALVLPWPHDVLTAGWAERDRLLPAAGRTVADAALGLGLACGLGFVGALVLASATWVRQALSPLVFVLQMMPVVILATWLALWERFGGIPAVPTIAFLISFFPVLANTTAGLLSVEPSAVDYFRLARASRWQELWLLRVPHCLPQFFTGAQIAATLAMIGALTGEIFAGSSARGFGLGFIVLTFQQQLKTGALLATALLACLLGFGFVGAVALARRWALAGR